MWLVGLIALTIPIGVGMMMLGVRRARDAAALPELPAAKVEDGKPFRPRHDTDRGVALVVTGIVVGLAGVCGVAVALFYELAKQFSH